MALAFFYSWEKLRWVLGLQPLRGSVINTELDLGLDVVYGTVVEEWLPSAVSLLHHSASSPHGGEESVNGNRGEFLERILWSDVNATVWLDS